MINLSQYTSWDDLIPDLRNARVFLVKSKACPDHYGLCRSGLDLPISISEAEFNFIKTTIIEKGYVSGFELATGTGVGTLAMAYALNMNGGSLVSFDSYAEELMQIQPTSKNGNAINATPLGLNSVEKMLSYFNVSADLRIGLSPGDPSNYLCHNRKTIDVVFLDCPKSDDDLERDIAMIKPYLADQYTIFIHDTHVIPSWTRIVDHHLRPSDRRLVHDFAWSKQKYPLAMVTK